MGVTYSASEIIRIAVQIERNGAEFYRRAAAAVEDRGAVELFRALAVSEDEHRGYFEHLGSTLPEAAVSGEEPDLYLKALADVVLFAGPPAAAGGDARAALQYALQAERDSIAYYSEILRFIAPGEKPRVQEIIAEEKNHLVRLTAAYRELA
jgi:rubrerythrin